MYAETDFILALIKDNDRLKNQAEQIFEEHQDELWTSSYTLTELMLISYREDRNVLKTINSVSQLIEIRGEEKKIKEAASYVSEEGFTPFEALHLSFSEGDKIISSDKDYDEYTERIKLEQRGEN